MEIAAIPYHLAHCALPARPPLPHSVPHCSGEIRDRGWVGGLPGLRSTNIPQNCLPQIPTRCSHKIVLYWRRHCGSKIGLSWSEVRTRTHNWCCVMNPSHAGVYVLTSVLLEKNLFRSVRASRTISGWSTRPSVCPQEFLFLLLLLFTFLLSRHPW